MKAWSVLIWSWLIGWIAGIGWMIAFHVKDTDVELPPEPEVITLYIERCSDPEVEDESHIDELYSAHEHYRRM